MDTAAPAATTDTAPSNGDTPAPAPAAAAPTAPPPAPPTPDTGNAEQTPQADPQLKLQLDAAAAEVEKWKKMARRNEERAKQNADAASELERLRREAMSEQERVTTDAKAVGRAEAMAEFGTKLVRAELRAASAGRIEADRLDALLERLDLRSFVDDDGNVKEDDVRQFVDSFAPPPPPKADADGNGTGEATTDPKQQTAPQVPDLGQGARGGSSMALNGDPLLQAIKSAVGIR